jgi:hypothetical protein
MVMEFATPNSYQFMGFPSGCRKKQSTHSGGLFILPDPSTQTVRGDNHETPKIFGEVDQPVTCSCSDWGIWPDAGAPGIRGNQRTYPGCCAAGPDSK